MTGFLFHKSVEPMTCGLLSIRRRVLPVCMWLAVMLSMALLMSPLTAQAATVWSGPKIVFTKADGASASQASNQDRLTANVFLTRGATQGLYNAAREAVFTHSVSPADTEWASGTTANYNSLQYADWETWARGVGSPPATTGVNAVLHLKTDDIYLDIKFISWSERLGGGFSYQRSTPSVAVPTSYLLSITTVGPGTVTSNPAGINCGSTCSASFNSGTSVTLTAAPASGSSFTGWTRDCTGTGTCVLSLAAAKTVTATFAATSVATVSFSAGWNLVGNGIEAPITVASFFNDPSKSNSVWKWNAVTAKWAFYTPTQNDGGAAYAASKGYETLTTINAGEGFWLQANTAFSLPMASGSAVQSASFRPAVSSPASPGGTHALRSGWSLIATGDNPTPAQFDLAIASATATLPAAGQVFVNFATLWAWDATKQNWYFWSPSLFNSNGLESYITSKNFLNFSAIPGPPGGTLSPMTGFWVNTP